MSSDAEDASSDPNYNGDHGNHDDLDYMADSPKGDSLAQKTESNASASSDQQTPTNGQSKPNPKDPLRPRRKKARRACFACQRAHLTCGDERPCQRCIKRGLQDQCHDGVRKKAKYLHDAPPEALVPPGIGGYHPPYINGTKASSNSSSSGVPMTGKSTAHTQSQYAQTQPSSLDIYTQNSQSQMPPPMQAHANAAVTFTQPPPISPQYIQNNEQHTSTMGHSVPPPSQSMNQYSGLPFDPSDPALFNFDIGSLNFGNHYGAMEFGMLNHMSSNANDLNQNQNDVHQINQIPAYSLNYGENHGLMFGQDALMNADWQSNHPRADSTTGLLSTPNNTPIVGSIDRPNGLDNFTNAFAIGAGPGSFASASPATSVAGQEAAGENPSSPALFPHPQAPVPSASPLFARSKAQPVQPPEIFSHETGRRKRPHDADDIYTSVTKPYGYTAGFHRLFNFISRRFSSEKRVRIAKAVSAVRPSLITFSQSLTDKDLIFMELSVQRKLYEYVDFINSYGTPTIITRRDGAIVAASKEFSILTGWSKAVLLGKEPNLNVNYGGASGPSTVPNSASRTRLPSVEEDRNANTAISGVNNATSSGSSAGPQPALMAEIMDQDSIVQFYEDYAKLAFGDPRGFGIRRGKLLKYKTKDDLAESEVEANHKRKRSASIKGEPAIKMEEGRISGEAGINQLGQKEGMVDVMYCWNVRRDVFEVPMLIVMNFLPLI